MAWPFLGHEVPQRCPTLEVFSCVFFLWKASGRSHWVCSNGSHVPPWHPFTLSLFSFPYSRLKVHFDGKDYVLYHFVANNSRQAYPLAHVTERVGFSIDFGGHLASSVSSCVSTSRSVHFPWLWRVTIDHSSWDWKGTEMHSPEPGGQVS